MSFGRNYYKQIYSKTYNINSINNNNNISFNSNKYNNNIMSSNYNNSIVVSKPTYDYEKRIIEEILETSN